MTSHAFKRPLEVNPEDTTAPAGPRENPLEEFARLMGADVRALQDFDNAGGVASNSVPSHAVAAPDGGATALREGEADIHGGGLPFDAIQPIDFDGFEEPLAAVTLPRRRRLGALTLGVIAVAVAGSLGTWAFKGAPGWADFTGGIAAEEPSKHARDAPAALRDPNLTAGNQTNAPAPVALVATETTTVAATPAPASAAPPVSPAAAPPITRSLALTSPTEGTPVPATTVDPTLPAATAPLQPKRAKSVAVRTDGSVIAINSGLPAAADPSPVPSDARTAAASVDAPPALRDPPTPVARPVEAAASSPKPTKQKPDAVKLSPKPVDREVVARIDAAAPDAAPAVPAAAAPSGGGLSAESVLQFVPSLYEKATSALRGPSPQAPAPAAEPSAPPSGAGFSAEPLLQFVPNLYQKATSALRNSPPATEVARAEPKPVAASGASAYAAQLASASTEAAALTAAARLQSKFPGELGALQPTIRQTEVDGRKIYQVRVGGMSKAEAAALCLKLGASGCSVAKD